MYQKNILSFIWSGPSPNLKKIEFHTGLPIEYVYHSDGVWGIEEIVVGLLFIFCSLGILGTYIWFHAEDDAILKNYSEFIIVENMMQKLNASFDKSEDFLWLVLNFDNLNIIFIQ